MRNPYLDEVFSPGRVMDPRNLGAMQPNRLSASRSFIARMLREGWRIERDHLRLDARGNGDARYTITTPAGPLTFAAWLREPRGKNRTGRIIGTSWDMLGTLIDGRASDAQIAASERELPKLYEGRAPEGTLIWMRSNQSLRLFRHVRDALAAGEQPDAAEVKRVGYLMRNTGLDGNGTFGSVSFPAIPKGHPLALSYHAQMLSAYLMRELSVDVVEELARIDAPGSAVRLDPAVRGNIGVGNGSALGLVMFVYNRPALINAYVSLTVEAVTHVLELELEPGDARFDRLERLLDRTIQYRALEDTQYRVFTNGTQLAADLRRVRAAVRAARRGEIVRGPGETLLAAAHRFVAARVTPEALHTFNSLLIELDPEHADALLAERLSFDETLEWDPRTPVSAVAEALHGVFGWALELPLNDPAHRDRVWYQSRAAEEPRSGPAEEVPGAHEVIPNYPSRARELADLLAASDPAAPIGALVAAHPELEHMVRSVLALRGQPYAVPHADPHDIDFVPVWLVRLMNAFIHGVDRTEDYLNRSVLGLIFDGAPYRDELAGARADGWWWRYRPAMPAAAAEAALAAPVSATAPTLSPVESAIRAPRHPEAERITMKFRELRLAGGRAMQALNVPEGSWHGARDFFVTALIADPAAVAGFGAALSRAIADDGSAPAWRAPSATRAAGGALEIDCHGASLHAVGHVLVQAIAAAADEAGIDVRLDGVSGDGAEPGLALALARVGIEVEAGADPAGAVPGSAGTALRLRARVSDDPAATRERYRGAFRRLIAEGLEVPAQEWWDVYYPGNAGLYPDTPLSRQHTGTVKDVYVPGQRLTRLFDPAEVANASDPNRDTDQLASLSTPHPASV
ncbi:hypothetical protein MUN78_09410 [Leucobacter allii]|uniref:Uncharacterized protein n=1 Tax=Leucobacter allii TaxID=2932247 RepID=A0ABY4FIL0_9MICO|nr:hypothetical protein [Leucobacter allii]UOQ55921.1 hypothetical protein MUN78_09410 [Leucobacter allii]